MELLTIILIALVSAFFLWIGYKLGRIIENQVWKSSKLDKIVQQRLKTSRSVIGGQVSEQIAPFLPNFPFKSSEIRFIGKPIDFLVFKGMDDKNIEEIVFVEVKTGKSSLSNQEKKVKEAILQKKVSWFEYHREK